jgi:pimeloyl-ACP methyl ester carboxylesterase
MPYADANGLRMYFEEHGRPDGPPLVLLHGFTATGAMWQAQLDALGARYRLLITDQRGHGRTDNPAGPAAMNHRQFARDIIALCRTLGIARAAFCGESSGAMQLLTLGLEAPDLAAALVLAGGTYFYGPELRAWWATLTPETLRQQFYTDHAEPGSAPRRRQP